MLRRKNIIPALTVVAALGLGLHPAAAEPVKTIVTVEEMHWAGCAKKLAVKLGAIAGVAKVDVDLKAKTLTVTHKDQIRVSPRALWEAVEKNNDKPVKISGPGGTFVARPPS